jgi:uracil-DNA glycosylase family 4
MGFFLLNNKIDNNPDLKGVSVDFLHRHQCSVCPLNNQRGLRHPHMEPTGSKKPLIVVLGEAPGKNEDRRGKQFVGRTGQLLRRYIPEQWLKDIRWNNCVRTRPPKNRTPTTVEIECCRPSIQADLEQTKPKYIFGFGNVPLHWATKQTGITRWNGRHVPVRVGDHVCWFFPFLHPSYVQRERNKKEGKETEFVFENDLRNAFRIIENGLPDPVVHSNDDAISDLEVVRSSERAIALIEALYAEPIVGVDYETRGIRPYGKDAKILTVGLAAKESSFAFPLYHRENDWTDQQLREVEDCFVEFLYSYKGHKVAHNLAFEMEWTAYFYGERVLWETKWGDSQSQAYILDERPDCHSLDFLCAQYFGVNIKSIDKLDKNNLDKEPLDAVLRYNALDAKYHRLLYLKQARRIKDEGLREVNAHQLRRVPTVVLTQIKGIPVDQKVVDEFYKEYNGDDEQPDKYPGKLRGIGDKIERLSIVKKFERVKNSKFNPLSNPDVLFVVRDLLKEDVTKVDEPVLSSIDHEFCKLILEYRGVAKLLSTYVLPLREGADTLWPDGMIHPIIRINKTRTWRSSGNDPNPQNYPKHENKELRKQVRGARNIRVVAFDYAGIQARNVAMESKDRQLVKVYWEHYDIHGDWCRRAAKLHPQWVKGSLSDTKTFGKYRQIAKNGFVFPSFFGAQPPKLSLVTGIPENKTRELLEEFWDEFRDVPKWHDRVNANYRKTGYVTGLSGFRRHAPVAATERINTPIQGDEVIIVLDAMARLSELGDMRYQANIEIHDDLTFFWPKEEIEKNSEIILREMLRINFDWINVPLVVERSIGEDWCDLEKAGEFESVGRDRFREITKK